MSGTIVGLIAAVIFILLYLVVDAGFLGALAASAVFYVGVAITSVLRDRRDRRGTGIDDGKRASPGRHGRRSQRSRDRHGAGASAENDPSRVVPGLGITQAEFDQELRDGTVKLTTLKRAADRITDRRVRGKAYAVCDSVARILSDIREDPKDLRPARKFLGYYLDATVTVLDRYTTLSEKQITSDELSASLRRAEESLDTIKRAYDKQLAQLLENDVMDLDTELEVLERTIRMEGLGEP